MLPDRSIAESVIIDCQQFVGYFVIKGDGWRSVTRMNATVKNLKPAQVLSIGELAAKTGTTVEAIRYYEKIGLLPPPARTAGNQRAYSRGLVDRLGYIRHSRELGFSLDSIRTLLSLVDRQPTWCDEVDAIAREHLVAIQSRIVRLRALEKEFKSMIASHQHGRITECRVIEVLADYTHSQCLTPDHGGTGI